MYVGPSPSSERQERWQANRASPPRVSSLRSGSPKGIMGKAVGGKETQELTLVGLLKRYPYSHSQAFKKFLEGATSITTPTAITASVRSTVTATAPAAASSSAAAAAAALHGPIGGLVLAVAAEAAEAVTVVASTVGRTASAASVGIVAAAATAAAVTTVAVVTAAAALGQAVLVTTTAAPAAASAAPGGPGAASTPTGVDILLGYGLLHLHAMALDRMELDHCGLVCRVVILKIHEAEATLLAGLLVGNNLGLFHGAKLREVLDQVALGHVSLKTPDKELLNLRVGTGPRRILPGHRPLQLHRVAVHGMGRGGHGGIGLLHIGVGHETKATGALGLRIHHHHAVRQSPKGLKVAAQARLTRLHIEAADEQLTQLGILHLYGPGLSPALRAPSFRRRRYRWLRASSQLGPSRCWSRHRRSPTGKGKREGEGRRRKGRGREGERCRLEGEPRRLEDNQGRRCCRRCRCHLCDLRL